MANFSDDEDLGPPAIAEARRDDWSDADESDYDESPKLVARARDHPIWSDDDAVGGDSGGGYSGGGSGGGWSAEKTDDDLAIRAGALFGGSKGDPIGDLRAKAKKLSRSAADSFDKYVRGAAAEAKKLRESRRKITALQAQGQKKIASVEKDKKLDDSAKEAQREQFKTLVADISEITSKIADNEKWLNAILAQSAVSTASAKAPSARTEAPSARAADWDPVSTNVSIGAGGNSTRKTATRNLAILVPAGAEMSWIGDDGKTGTHRARPGGQLFKVRAGARYEFSNRTGAPAIFTTVH